MRRSLYASGGLHFALLLWVILGGSWFRDSEEPEFEVTGVTLVSVQDFEAMFPEWRQVETPWFWTGLVCLTGRRVPYVGPVPDLPGAFAGFGWHGNGVAMGTYAGRMLAGLALGQETSVPEVLKRTPTRIPLGLNRRLLLPPIYEGLAVRDWLD